jgi:hypothetical protein
MAEFQAQFLIKIIVDQGGGRWLFRADIEFFGPGSYGFGVNSVQVGDSVILQSSNPLAQTQKFVVDEITSITGIEMDGYITYDDTGISPTGVAAHTAIITAKYINGFLGVPSSIWCRCDEFLIEYVNTKNAEKIETGGNKTIQGLSGFASHELDGSNNDVNSFIEWDSTDQTHYHRVEPKVDAQDLDIKIGFQFPSSFTGLVDSGTALEFYAKADDGSGDAVNSIQLTQLVDTDGTEYDVTGKTVILGDKTSITMTKAEIDSALNPVVSSSSASTVSWDSGDAGQVIYARFKLFGNIGDKVYLDQDNAFMYLA